MAPQYWGKCNLKTEHRGIARAQCGSRQRGGYGHATARAYSGDPGFLATNGHSPASPMDEGESRRSASPTIEPAASIIPRPAYVVDSRKARRQGKIDMGEKPPTPSVITRAIRDVIPYDRNRWSRPVSAQPNERRKRTCNAASPPRVRETKMSDVGVQATAGHPHVFVKPKMRYDIVILGKRR